MLKGHKYQADARCHNLAARAYADRLEVVKGQKGTETLCFVGQDLSSVWLGHYLWFWGDDLWFVLLRAQLVYEL